MKTDIEPGRIVAPPAKRGVIFEGTMESQGHSIRKMELRQYVERTDERLGVYSLITILVETDRGSVEMKYDEGFRGDGALEAAATFLKEYAGIATVINRALIELER